MSYIYLKLTIEKNFDLLILKNLSLGKYFGELQLKQVSLNSKNSCCKLKIRGLGAKLCVAWAYPRKQGHACGIAKKGQESLVKGPNFGFYSPFFQI